MDLSDILEQLDDETLKEIAGDATDYTSDKGIEDLLETVYNNASIKAINNFIKFFKTSKINYETQYIVGKYRLDCYLPTFGIVIDDVLEEFEPDDIINYLNQHGYKIEKKKF